MAKFAGNSRKTKKITTVAMTIAASKVGLIEDTNRITLGIGEIRPLFSPTIKNPLAH